MKLKFNPSQKDELAEQMLEDYREAQIARVGEHLESQIENRKAEWKRIKDVLRTEQLGTPR